MEVVCDGVPCRVEVRGSVIACAPLDGAEGAGNHVFARHEISQLLRSRRDQNTVKILVGPKSILMRFADPREREVLIDMVQNMETSAGGNDRWVASTICQTAVDFGLLDEAALDSLVKEELSRGVVIAFDAIGSLVDPATFKLCPITDQLESDIFRQVPILARIFERRVTDEETRQRFWEAVVRKYFCFSRTFLEEDMHELEAAGAAGTATAGQQTLSGINAASGRALPKAKARGVSPTRESPATERGPLPHARLFAGRRRLPFRRVKGGERCVALRPPAAAETCFPPPSVSRVMPKENTDREVLELLRAFWRGDANQKRGLRAKLESARDGSNSVWQRRCVLRAREFLKELGPKGRDD